MAEIVTERAEEGVQPYVGNSGEMCVAYGTHDFAANPATGDTVAFCKLPAGAIVVGGHIYGDILDTNGNPTAKITLGTAASTSLFSGELLLSGSALNATLTVNTLKDGFVDIASAVTVIGTMTTAATFQAGTVTLVVYYTMP